MRIDINDGWEFTPKYNDELSAPIYKVGDTTEVRIPHCVNVTPFNYVNNKDYEMISGYRKVLSLPREWEGKRLILTFDALYAEIYTDAYPLLKQNNMKANVFVNPDYIGQQGRMTQAQLKEMADSGVMSLQCALNQYESLELVPKEEVRTRVTNAKNGVTAITGKEPIAFEYPVGSVDSHELEVCSSLFKFCLRRSGDRAYDTSRDSGSLIYQFTMQRDTPLAMFSFWAGKAK